MKKRKAFYRSSLRLNGWFVFIKDGKMSAPVGGEYFLIHKSDLSGFNTGFDYGVPTPAHNINKEMKTDLIRAYATRKTLVERNNVIPPDMQFSIEREKNLRLILQVNKLS
jgi:hypothetical protein